MDPLFKYIYIIYIKIKTNQTPPIYAHPFVLQKPTKQTKMFHTACFCAWCTKTAEQIIIINYYIILCEVMNSIDIASYSPWLWPSLFPPPETETERDNKVYASYNKVYKIKYL